MLKPIDLDTAAIAELMRALENLPARNYGDRIPSRFEYGIWVQPTSAPRHARSSYRDLIVVLEDALRIARELAEQGEATPAKP